MGNLLGFIFSVVVSLAIVFKTIKLLLIYKNHSITVSATVSEVSELGYSNESIFNLKVHYIFNNIVYDTNIDSYLFVKPSLNSNIEIKVNPLNPLSAKYYGHRDKFYYLLLIAHIIFGIGGIISSFYYFNRGWM